MIPKSHVRNFSPAWIQQNKNNTNLSTYINPPVIPNPSAENFDSSRRIWANSVYKGININNTIPNRYPYMFDTEIFPGLYYETGSEKESDRSGYPTTNITPMIYPVTNRNLPFYTEYTRPIIYESLLDAQNLRPDFTTFYN